MAEHVGHGTFGSDDSKRAAAREPGPVRTSRAPVRGKTAPTAWLARPLSSLHLLLAVFGLLVVVGLVMVLSASSTASYQMGGSSYAVFDRMLVYVAIGLVLFWIAVRTPLSVVRQASFPLLLVSMGLLVLVLTPLGVGRYGAHRWLTMGPVVFEPVEVAKLALTLWA